MSEEYSLAVFEDGSTEMIPKSWIQDYLPPQSESDNAEATYVHLQPPFKKNTQHECFSYTPSSDEQYFTNMISIKTSTIEEISKMLQTLANSGTENKEAINRLQRCVDRVICIATGEAEQDLTVTQPGMAFKSEEQMTFTPSSSNLDCFNETISVQASTIEEISRTLKILAKTVAENKEAINRLQKCVDRVICIATGEPETEACVSHPAETLTEFLAIEEYIKFKPNYDEMVQTLSKIGGRTVESTTRKVWNRLCSTQLASSICWTGANGKYCLKPLLLNNLVRDSVLITHHQGKESDIQRATMLWFSHAQDRLRARKNSVITPKK